MPSLIKAYEDGTLAALQAEERAHKTELPLCEEPVDVWDYDEDDCAEEWCATCHNTGEIDCHCGGDLCVCRNNGSYPCPDCGY